MSIESLENGPFSIEIAHPQDAAAIAHVRNETWLATYPNEEAGITKEDILTKAFESEEQVARWRKNIEDTTGTRALWVAKTASGMIVGYSQGKRSEADRKSVV